MAVAPNDRDSGLGLAEVVAAFSLATDLGLGQPMEHVLRSWAIATRLGEHMGIETENAAALYYCLLYTSPSPRDRQKSRMPSSA